MKKKDVEFFKEHLTKRLDELLNQADNTVSGMTSPKENLLILGLTRGRSEFHAAHPGP